MRHLAIVLVLAACGGKHAPARADDRVARLAEAVEHGILPVVQVRGEPQVEELAAVMAEYRVPGLSVAVFADDRVVWAQGFGVTEAGGATPVTTSTLFQAGSISKTVNAVAVLQALDLDAPINDQLTSWKLPDNELTAKTPVTPRHLLSHTAGTTVHGFPGYEAGASLPSIVQVLDGAPPANTPPVRVDLAPGHEFRYSGGGTTITQLALVDTLGVPYPELMRARVLAPIGMTASTYEQPLPDARVADAAAGTHADGQVVPGKRHVYPEMAAAGLWTTPTDLARFFLEITRALAGRSKVLTRELAEQMLTPIADISETDQIGLGVFLTHHNGTPVFGHDGADDGFQASAVASRDGFGVVVMANSDQGLAVFPAIQRTVWAVMGWPGSDPEIERVILDEVDRSLFVGDWALPDGRVARIDDALQLSALPFPSSELVAVARDRVVDRGSGLAIEATDDGLQIEGVALARLDASVVHPLRELAEGRFDAAVTAWQANPSILSEQVTNLLGYEALQRAAPELAVEVFRLVAATFPDSSNAFDSLADGLTALGDKPGAIEALEHSLELLDADPRIPDDDKPARRENAQLRLTALR